MLNRQSFSSLPVATVSKGFRTQKLSGLCSCFRASARVTSFQQPKEVTKKGRPHMPLFRQNATQIRVGSNAGPTASSLNRHPCRFPLIWMAFCRGPERGLDTRLSYLDTSPKSANFERGFNHFRRPRNPNSAGQNPLQARDRSAVKSGEFRRDAKLGPAAPGARVARPRFGCASGEERACGASFFSPLFLDEQKKGLARMQGRDYGVPSVVACETITRNSLLEDISQFVNLEGFNQ